MKVLDKVWACLRLALGWIFLWAFLDKVFGLGFSTAPDKAWLAGVSPTAGYLTAMTSGPFASFYQSIAGNSVVDLIFMLGLLLLGVSLLLGIGVRFAGYAGALLMFLMWTSALPPQHNPFLDEHIVYIIVLVGLAYANAGMTWGLGKWWSKTNVAKRYPFLR